MPLRQRAVICPQLLDEHRGCFGLITPARGEVTSMKETAPIGIEPLTDAEVRQGFEAMKQADASAMLDEPSRQRKVQIIKKILENDADIRSRTVAWMGQLQRIMQSNRQEQRLQQAYGG